MPSSVARPTASNQDLLRIIRFVRNRWRLRVALRGFAVVLAAGFTAFLAATLLMDLYRYTPGAVLAGRITVYLALGGLAIGFLVLPLLRRLPDERVALYLEENEPSLQATLLSAVEAEHTQRSEISPALARRLSERAIEACRSIDNGRAVEQPGLRRNSGILAGVLAVTMLVVLLNPAFLRHGAPFLLFPWNSELAANPYTVEVSPGDTRIARGADQLVAASLEGFTATTVELALRRSEHESWQRRVMSSGAESGNFELFLFDLDEAVDYYVEAGGLRSAIYRIEVIDLPQIDRLDLTYRFPAYSGLPPQTVEDGDDIAALRGTEVELQVHTTFPAQGAELVLDGDERSRFTPTEDGVWTAQLGVNKDGYYRIELRGDDGEVVTVSPDYAIDALDDQAPSVTFSGPGRDVKVTRVEEPHLAVEAQDDFGVGRLELLLSVNGAAEQSIELPKDTSPAGKMAAGHTLYLEDLDLQPGDFISYHARVRDNYTDGGQQGMTDLYFMEVRPFRLDYRQANQQGGGGGGNQQLEDALSAQQRQLVVAIFNAIRDRTRPAVEDNDAALTTLALAQARIRDRVQAIVRRLLTRNIVQLEPGYQRMAIELPKASTAMDEAEERLVARDPEPALTKAQQALQHLQRAEAAFRDVQVSRARQSGGGSSNRAAEDLANLFKLELDKFRNQYENVQRDRQQQAEREIDEIMQRLRELARRQQRENERMQRRTQQQSGGSGSGNDNQRALADTVEELARKLERLSREQPELRETLRQMQQANEAMRQAAAADNQQSLEAGRTAMERLQEARRLLDSNRSDQLARNIEGAQRRAQRLADAQRESTSEVEALQPEDGAGGGERERQLERVSERKQQMAEEVDELETELGQLGRESQSENPQTSRKLQAAANAIRASRLIDKLRQSQRGIRSWSQDYAERVEQLIDADIAELQEKIAAAAGSLDETREQRLARSLEQMQALARDLEALRERMAANAQQSSENQSGEQSSESQSGEQTGQDQSGKQSSEDQQGQSAAGQDSRQARAAREPRPGGGSNQGGGRLDADTRGGRLDSTDIRRFQQAFTEHYGEAKQLRQDFLDLGVDAIDIDAVLRRLQELGRDAAYGDLDELASLQADAIETLKALEYALRRELRDEQGNRLILSETDRAPAKFRELVEAYYRELSRDTPR